MWRTILSNFHESLLLDQQFLLPSPPTRQQHLAVATALSQNEGSSQILMNLRNELCSSGSGSSSSNNKDWKSALELLRSGSISNYINTHQQKTSSSSSAVSSSQSQQVLHQHQQHPLSSFLIGSLVLHECNEKRWWNGLKILNDVMMEQEPWSLRENFVRRVVIELPKPEMRLVLAKKYVQVENKRVAREEMTSSMTDDEVNDDDGEINGEKENSLQQNTPRNLQQKPVIKHLSSPCELLSFGFRHALVSQISVSIKQDPSSTYWKDAIEFFTDQQQHSSNDSNSNKNNNRHSSSSSFPCKPSEFSNYLLACNSKYGMWRKAIEQIQLHYRRALLLAEGDIDDGESNDDRNSIIKTGGDLNKICSSSSSELWDGSARVSRFFCLQWMCATYSSVPAHLRPHEVPKPIRDVANELLLPCCFVGGGGRGGITSAQGCPIHFSADRLSSKKKRSSIGEKVENVQNSKPEKFDSSQACCNMVLMMQRSCSWLGATKLLDEYLKLRDKSSNNDNGRTCVFLPTLLHYNACLDSNAGWSVCLAQFCKMRSQLGPPSAKKSWGAYVESYNTKFKKFANHRDPNLINGDVFRAHEYQLYLRLVRAFTRSREVMKKRRSPPNSTSDENNRNHGDDEPSMTLSPPLWMFENFLNEAPESIRNHQLYRDVQTKTDVMMMDETTRKGKLLREQRESFFDADELKKDFDQVLKMERLLKRR